MGCGGSKPANDGAAQPARTAKASYKAKGPGRTLSGATPSTSSVPSNAGNAAAAAAARREDAQRAAEARAKTKLKPQQPLAEPVGGNKNVTNSDTLAWN